MPLITGDHLGTGLLIGPHHLAPRFRVELAGQHRRVDQVAEQYRELAAFGLGGMRFGWWRFGGWGMLGLAARRWRGFCQWWTRLPGPNQALVLVLDDRITRIA